MQHQTFFEDPAIDAVFKVVFSLAAELQVTRARLRAVEKVLVAQGVIAADAVETWQSGAEEDAARLAELDAMIGGLFAACIPQVATESRTS